MLYNGFELLLQYCDQFHSQKISLLFTDESQHSGKSNKNQKANESEEAPFFHHHQNSSALKKSTLSKHSFDNLNSLQNTSNMKIISKINSISSLNDKNLEKFTMGSFATNSNNNNNRFLATTKSYIDFLPGGSANYSFDRDNLSLLESQPLGSAKSLKFNNNGDHHHTSASAVFWDSFTKLPIGLSSMPATSTSNLRNTVSSSNLALNVNFTESIQPIPMVLPQKFQFTQPQAQPLMKSSSGNTQHLQPSSSGQDEQMVIRKNSLPHNSSTNSSSQSSSVASRSNSFRERSETTVTSSQSCDQQQQSKTIPSKWPIVASPHQVMMLYMNKLTPYEHHEIYKYSQIYFIGANAKKRSGSGPNNSDYDNENGSYIHIPHDHVAYRYEVLKIIGKGSFGQVVKAYDHKTREHVALKMVRNEKRFHRQAQEEIRILKHLRSQDKENTFNIIHM